MKLNFGNELIEFIKNVSFQTLHLLKIQQHSQPQPNPPPQRCDGAKSSENAKNLANIDLDCQSLIVEQLDLDDLLSIAQTNTHFNSLAGDVFRRKFGQKLFVLLPDWNVLGGDKFGVEATRVLITSSELAENLLKMFGHLISKVSVFFERVDFQFDLITGRMAKLINKFCWKSLVHLEMNNCPVQIWKELKNPFLNVENVTFKNLLRAPKDFDLNQVFPNMRRLELHDVELIESGLFDHAFVHLEHISIKFFVEVELFVNDVTQMITKNQQIRNVSLEHASAQFLELLSENLPQIEVLEFFSEIQDFPSSERIHFGNVKSVLMKFQSFNAPIGISFPQIEQFELDIQPELTESWIQYIKQHENSKKLHLNGPVLDSHIAALSDGLPNLIDVSLNCASDVKVETIISFIVKNQQMKTLLLNTRDEPLRKILKSTLEQQRFDHPLEIIIC